MGRKRKDGEKPAGRGRVRERERDSGREIQGEGESGRGRVRERVREIESQRDGLHALNVLHVLPHRSPFPLLWYQHRACWQ